MIPASLNNSIGRGGFPPAGARGGTQAAGVLLTGSVNGPGRVQPAFAESLLSWATDHVCSSIGRLELVGMCSVCGLFTFAKVWGP